MSFSFDTLAPLYKYVPIGLGLWMVSTMGLAAFCYFGLVREFYKDFKASPIWLYFGILILCLWGGMACLLTALCYFYRAYIWTLVIYNTNSIVVAVFYAFYRRRNYDLIVKYRYETFAQFVGRVYREMSEKGLIVTSGVPPTSTPNSHDEG